MAALADLQLAPWLLCTLLNADPRFLLVNAIAWLDPRSLLNPDAQANGTDFNYDAEEDGLPLALAICREHFLPVYAGAVQLETQGAPQYQIERYVLDGISAHLVTPVQDLEELPYGPPIDFSGVYLSQLTLEDAENEPYDQLRPVFSLFGINPTDDDLDDDQAAETFFTVSVLTHSLSARSESVYHDLSDLLEWMFSCSGNTAIDYTDEAFWDNGFTPADWTSEDIKMINDINQQAHEFLNSALNALQQLTADPDLYVALKRNIKAVSSAIRKHNKKKGKAPHVTARHANRPDPAAFSHYTLWPERA